MTDEIREAKKRIKRKKKFYNQVGSWVATSIFLLGLNTFTSPGYMWAWWPIGFWGISLLFEGANVIFKDKTDQWGRKALRKELEEMGYDPDDVYDEDDHLELDDRVLSKKPIKGYRDSDLV